MTTRKKVRRDSRRLYAEGLEPRILLTSVLSANTAVVYTDNITTEAGGNAIFTIRLLLPPTDTVTIPIASSNTAEGVVFTTQVVFDATNWNVFKQVTVFGKQDPDPGVDDGPIGYAINLGPMISGDANYNGKTPTAVPFINLDDDCVAVNDTGLTLPEDATAALPVRGNDLDLGGDGSYHVSNAVVLIGGGSVATDGANLIYQAAENYNGQFLLEYTLTNEFADVSIGRASGNVTPVGDAPVAVADSVTTFEDTPINVYVIENDTDVDSPWFPSQGLKAASIESVTNGTATILTTPQFVRFVPDANSHATGTVSYYVMDSDGWVSESPATITIEIVPRNDKPKANKGGAGLQTNEDTPVAISLDDDDEDPEVSQALTYTLVTSPTHGSVNWQTMEYTPSENYHGSDSFQYTVTDDETAGDNGPLTSDVATVAVTITPVNDAPTAENRSMSPDEDTPDTIDLAGYADVDDTMRVVTVGTAQLGTVSVSGSIATYVPLANVNGEDAFSYTVTDPLGAFVTRTVAVTVIAANDLPDAVGDATSVGALMGNTPPPAILSVLENDTDIDFLHEGDVHVVQSVTQGTYGAVEIYGVTQVKYIPSGTYTLSDTFTYTLVDEGGATDTATVYVTYSWTGALLAARPAMAGTPSGAVFADDEEFSMAVAPLVAEAAARWAATGIDTSALAAAKFGLADLDGEILGLEASGTILIDRDAAGFGWFVDASPSDEREYFRRRDELWARPGGEAFGEVDLLTVLMHEVGHLLGVGHAENGLMADTLAAGVRRVPTADALWIDELLTSPRAKRAAVDALFAERSGW